MVSVIGQRFGRLIVDRVLPRRVNVRTRCRATCDCGVKKYYRLRHLYSGHTKSCGCFRRDVSAQAEIHNVIRHGQRGGSHTNRTRTYISYRSMIQRCYDLKATGFKYWGGRGIKVCRSWRGKFGFAHFFEQMGARPAGTSLDRKNPNGNYCKSNCRWATPKEQQGHLRRARQ